MPELPEVEIVKRGLERGVLGKEILACRVYRSGLRYRFHENMVDILSGSTLRALDRRGKYIIAQFSNDWFMVWHLGMSGVVKIVPAGGDYVLQKHDHVVLDFLDGTTIAYNDARRFGFMLLLTPDEFAAYSPLSKMGPEPLGNGFDPICLYEALQKKNTSIKQALLDQSVVAGLGNIYVCEALYHAKIDPRRKAASLSAQDVARLEPKIRSVLNLALDSGGSSLKDYRHTDGALGYFQHQFCVYDKESSPCARAECGINGGVGIQRIVQAGRSTFYCPECQI